jgi:hypothetical protein
LVSQASSLRKITEILLEINFNCSVALDPSEISTKPLKENSRQPAPAGLLAAAKNAKKGVSFRSQQEDSTQAACNQKAVETTSRLLGFSGLFGNPNDAKLSQQFSALNH